MKRTAIITGASRGIGRAIALELAKKGFSLALVYKNSHDKMKSLENELDGKCEYVSICADIRDSKQVEKAYQIAKEKFGFIDTVVNNAGISHIEFFDKETQESYDEVMDTNFRSAFTMCLIASKDMIAKKFGRIINVSSVWGQKGSAMEVLYSSSKHALIGLTRSLNAELAPSGILVNAVCPGVIDTDMNNDFSEHDKIAISQDIPLGRFGKAEEVAKVVSLLADENLYIGGEDIAVTAGY